MYFDISFILGGVDGVMAPDFLDDGINLQDEEHI